MFGNPQWFRLKTWGWGLHPTTWQGWSYLGGWLSVMLMPYVYFLSQRQWTEGFVWLGVLGGAMLYDVWLIVGAIKNVGKPKPAEAKPTAAAPVAKKNDVLYIGDEPSPSELATKKYDLRLQR